MGNVVCFFISKRSDFGDLGSVVSLVAFHPAFECWHSLAPGIGPVSASEEVGGRRSVQRSPAVGTSVDPLLVGVRRVGVTFLDDRATQWVPLDWQDPRVLAGEALLDNWMHRSPQPTIHLIRRQDLQAVREVEDGHSPVSEVQRRNQNRLQDFVFAFV